MKLRRAPSRKKKTQGLSNSSLELSFLKTRIFHHGGGLEMSSLRYGFKQALRMIALFHRLNKRILIVGGPLKVLWKVTEEGEVKLKSAPYKLSEYKRIPHTFIPSKAWVRGLLTNQNHLRYKVRTRKYKRKETIDFLRLALSQVQEGIELAVVFNAHKSEGILKEIGALNIPLIVFDIKERYYFPLSYHLADILVEGDFITTRQDVNKFVFNMIFRALARL